MIDYTYLIFMLPALICSLWAQAKVKSAFTQASRMPAPMTGAQAAQMVMDQGGAAGVEIDRIPGELTDNYDPRDNRIHLSQPVCDAATMAAVGVAAHEAGHAVQYAQGYGPVRVRTAIIPVCQFGSTLSWPLLLLGIFLESNRFFLAGIILFCAVVLFQLVTLPVEFNASDRALAALDASGYFTEEQMAQAQRVLRAAAMTYVAALATSMAQLLRLLAIFGGNSRRRD